MTLSYDHVQLIWKIANACQLLWIFLLYSCAMMLWNGLLMVVDLARNLVLRAVL